MMKDKSKNEKYAEKWLIDNGYDFSLVKQYNSKTIYDVQADGIEIKWELPSGVEDIKAYMKQVKILFDMKMRIIENDN